MCSTSLGDAGSMNGKPGLGLQLLKRLDLRILCICSGCVGIAHAQTPRDY